MPFWLDTAVAIASLRASSASANRRMTAARSAGVECAQPAGSSKAARAAATAASTSASIASGTEPITSPVFGEVTVMRRSLLGVDQRPPM